MDVSPLPLIGHFIAFTVLLVALIGLITFAVIRMQQRKKTRSHLKNQRSLR